MALPLSSEKGNETAFLAVIQDWISWLLDRRSSEIKTLRHKID
jgi:hypothetical protein